jgi:hypothetical protein
VVEPTADENRKTIVAGSIIALAIGINIMVGSAILTAVDETKKVVAMMDLKIRGRIRVLSFEKNESMRVFRQHSFDLIRRTSMMQKHVQKYREMSRHVKKLNKYFAPKKPWIEKGGAITSGTSRIIEAKKHIDGK